MPNFVKISSGVLETQHYQISLSP